MIVKKTNETDYFYECRMCLRMVGYMPCGTSLL